MQRLSWADDVRREMMCASARRGAAGGGISHAVTLDIKSRHALERAVSVGSTGFRQLRRAHKVEHKGLDPVASTPRNQLPPVPPAHHLPMRVLAQMRHRKLGETGGHGHSNLHLEPTLASWHPRMARPRALAQASVERPRDEASPATSWSPAGASQLLPPATLLHSIGLLRQA